MQTGQRGEEQYHPIEEKDENEHEESTAHSPFVYAMRSQITRDHYLRRLRILLITLIYFLNEREWK